MPKAADRKSEVWFSQLYLNSQIMKPLRSSERPPNVAEPTGIGPNVIGGELAPTDWFPPRIYGVYPDAKVGRLPPIFEGGGGLIVSDAVVEVLKRFDLGRTAFPPVDIFEHDRKTPVAGTWFFLDIAEQKKALLPERSEKLKRSTRAGVIWSTLLIDGDDQIAVRATALTGPDLWIDPAVYTGVFLNGALVEALRAGKFTRQIELKRCRVVQDN
jgi:hypothetical protein